MRSFVSDIFLNSMLLAFPLPFRGVFTDIIATCKATELQYYGGIIVL